MGLRSGCLSREIQIGLMVRHSASVTIWIQYRFSVERLEIQIDGARSGVDARSSITKIP